MVECNKWAECKTKVRDMEDKSTLELLSTVTEFNDLHAFMQDEDVDLALSRVIKLISKPDVPPAVAAKLIVELQALSAKFAVLATYYATVGKHGTEETHKKNVCFTLKEALSKLSDAMKYSVKAGY